MDGRGAVERVVQEGDRVLQAVRLEANYLDRVRFLAVVEQGGGSGGHAVLGIDATTTSGNDEDDEGEEDTPTLGLVLEMMWDTDIKLDGDGGFSLIQKSYRSSSTSSSVEAASGGDGGARHFIFKPVSVQALWTVIQTLHMIKERTVNPSTSGTPHKWILNYQARIRSSQSCINEWHEMADLLVRRPPSPGLKDGDKAVNKSEADRETTIKTKLRCIMKTVDLDTITSKIIRTRLEQEMEECLESFKSFIDQEILLILGQMDPASKILDYLFLGSEWNASNLDELRQNGISHILNVTREIDNFYPAVFTYRNIRVYDEEITDLLRHFDSTYKFIRDAKANGGKVLVHCKMGISRSASVVISYLMKEYEMDLEQALIRAQERRSIVNPNKSFIKQLEVYEGMLKAIRHRLTYYGRITRSKSESSLVQSCSSGGSDLGGDHGDPMLPVGRPNRPKRSHSSRVAETHCKYVDVKALSEAYIKSLASGTNEVFSAKRDDAVEEENEENDDKECKCFGSLSQGCQGDSDQTEQPFKVVVVNSAESGFDPECDCDVEVELNVPDKPVEIDNMDDGSDEKTNNIVQSLANVPIQIRSSHFSRRVVSLQEHSSTSSLSSSSAASSPTLSGVRRRSSAAGDFGVARSNNMPHLLPKDEFSSTSETHSSSSSLSTIIQTTTTCDTTTSGSASDAGTTTNNDVLSVKTLANMFDFKINTGSITTCAKFCASLEDNKMYKKAAKDTTVTTMTTDKDNNDTSNNIIIATNASNDHHPTTSESEC